MPAGKKGAKASAKAAAARHIKDLDLALPVTDDLDIVHNKKQRERAYAAAGVADDDGDDDGHIAVLPGEAHDESDDDYENFEDMRDAAQMAAAASRQHRKGLDDDDFGVAGLAVPAAGPSSSASAARGAKGARGSAAGDAPTLEEVERDFAKLSSGQRLAMLKKESPEVITLMQELRSHIAAAHDAAGALKSARVQAKRGAREHELVDFLETKAALLLTYCSHVAMYLLLKAEGAQVSGHPVVDRLVEIRTYIEKLHPVEQRLSYSLNKLLSGQAAASAPNVARLRPVAEHGGELFQANKSRAVDDDKAARRRAQARLDRQQELDNAEEAEMTRTRGRAIMRDGDLELLQAADPGTEERTDHFLSGMVDYEGEGSDDSDDDGGAGRGSLMDKLRAKVSSAAKEKLRGKPTQPKKKKAAKAAEDDDEGAFDDEFGGEGDDDVDYEALLAEEYAREADAGDAAAAARGRGHEEREAERRQVTQKILSHRGLTKSRPKDKKNPRVAKREKYSKGSKAANAQGRAARADRPDNFMGVPAIKTTVTHSTRLS